MLDLETNMDSAQGDRKLDYKDRNIDATIRRDHEHDLSVLGNKPVDETISSSSSSTSTDSSEEDFFQMDASELNRMVAASDILSAQHGGSARLASEFGIRNGEAIGISLSSKHGALCDIDDIVAGSQYPVGRPLFPEVSGSSSEPDISVPGTILSPPVQTMTRYDVPDPNRIPSSIFARSKSTKPMEWSVASNESLFSIQMGNSSFSRDHMFLLGKSGELGNTPPLSPLPSPNPIPPTLASPKSVSPLPSPNPNSPLASPNPIPPLSSANPIPPFASTYPPNMEMGQGLAQPSAAEATNAEAMKDVLRAAVEEHATETKPPAEDQVLSSRTSHHSDGSTASFSSFAFPILTGEGRSGSVKVEPEPQQLQKPQNPSTKTETPKSDPAAAGNKWFSCYFCCPFCH